MRFIPAANAIWATHFLTHLDGIVYWSFLVPLKSTCQLKLYNYVRTNNLMSANLAHRLMAWLRSAYTIINFVLQELFLFTRQFHTSSYGRSGFRSLFTSLTRSCLHNALHVLHDYDDNENENVVMAVWWWRRWRWRLWWWYWWWW